jgi:hypothetical protein
MGDCINSCFVFCCVACVVRQIGITQQPARLMGSCTYQHVAGTKEKLSMWFPMDLERVNIGKTQMSMERPLCNLYSGVPFSPAVFHSFPGVSCGGSGKSIYFLADNYSGKEISFIWRAWPYINYHLPTQNGTNR